MLHACVVLCSDLHMCGQRFCAHGVLCLFYICVVLCSTLHGPVWSTILCTLCSVTFVRLCRFLLCMKAHGQPFFAHGVV